jgi:hypothetical protein
MNRSSEYVEQAAGQPGEGLEGKWIQILDAGLAPLSGVDSFTPEDLDNLVDEYQDRDEDAKAPVVLGLPSEGSSAPVGKIDAVKKIGPALYGKFAGVDPRAEFLHTRGVFPKKAVQIKRSPDGVSLQKVGLVRPSLHAGTLRNEGTPSLDELMAQNAGDKELVLSERVSRTRGSSSVTAAGAVAHLKERGYWIRRFDHHCFPAMFEELEGTPALGLLVTFIERLCRECDPTTALLSERARYLAQSRGITFSEALDRVQRLQSAGRASGPGARLSQLAYEAAESNGVSFGEALERVAAENPELTR